MGVKSSKKQKNNHLKEIGEKANKECPDTFYDSNIINFNSEVIVTENKTDPNLDYKKLNLLGEGSFFSVYRVLNRISDTVRAMKIIKKSDTCSDEDDKEILNEINILRQLDHPNILKIFEFYSNKESYSIVTELCLGGYLFQEIANKGPFNENCSAYVIFQILSGINYCHNMKIAHRDLNVNNIFISGRDKNNYPRVKIGDFGTSIMLEKGTVQRKIIGSSYYTAPEVLQKHYDEKCDVWSCGVILYILLSGKQPFEGENETIIREKILLGQYDLKITPFNKVSKNCINLIKQLLNINPNERINAKEALAHPWFKEKRSKELFNQINDESVIKDLIINLRNYKRGSIIQETTLAYLVHNFPQMKDVVNACKLFNQIDVSGDGKINKAELLKGLKSKIKSDNLEKDVEIVYKNLDLDNNGYIEYEEFVRASINKKNFINEKVLKFAFRYFDKDGSGEIAFNEIEEIFKQNVSDKSKVHDSLMDIIKEVDLNKDGIISFKEFSDILIKMLKK